MASRVEKVTTGATLLLCSVFGLLTGSCTTQQINTPTRSLDRPSDAALFCVDYELDYDGNNCLPQGGDPDGDPAGYLDSWCSGITWRDITPKATVLALEECDEAHRRLRSEAYFAKVRAAARSIGRDPDWPCCPSDNTACGTQAPACARRGLSMVIANTSRGELAVANTNLQPPGLSTVGRLQNLHDGEPGFGFLPTGLLPEHVRTLSVAEGKLADGRAVAPNAWAVTTNIGSCDVSMIKLQPVATLTQRADSCDDSGQSCPTHGCDAQSCPQQIRPWFANGAGNPTPLQARPGWVEIAPWADAVNRAVIIAYPTCGLIAVVNLGDTTQPGRISEALAFDPTGVAKPRLMAPADLAKLNCPADCGSDPTPLMPDVTTLPAGGVKRAAAYPATLAVDTEGHRLLVGDQVGTALTVLDLNVDAGVPSHLIGPPRQVPLDFESRNEGIARGSHGLDVIRVTPRTLAGRFAYVMARDSTVRVVDLDREVECETNPDPRFLMQNAALMSSAPGSTRILPDELNESNLRRLSCIPVSASTPRRPLVATPGITQPNGSVPNDVGFIHQDTIPCNNPDPTMCTYWPDAPQTSWLKASGSVWVGDFGWVLGGAGALLGLQVADSCPQPNYRACFADCGAQRRLALLHTRSQELPTPEQYLLPALPQALIVSPQDRLGNTRRNYSRFEDQLEASAGPVAESDSAGLPVYSSQIAGAFATQYTTVPGGTRRQLNYPTPAPYYYLPVDPVCDVAIGPQAVDLSSPDTVLPAEPTRRPVTIAAFTDPLAATTELWSLSWEGLLSPQLSRSSGRLLSTSQMVDLNGLYCNRGVEPKDKLWLTGCLSNSDCIYGTLCRQEQLQGTAPGMCLANDAADLCRTLSQQLMVDTSGNTEWATTWLRRYKITKAQQQVAVTAAGSDVLDALTLDEIAEPEFDLERKSCTMAELGTECAHYQTWVLPRHAPINTTALVSHKAYCRVTGVDATGAPTPSCIMQCQLNTDCGDGFVCARSPYEQYESGNANIMARPGRCVRAPLITAKTPTLAGTPLGDAGAAALIHACFPDELRYEIRGGDAFVVSGALTGAPALEERDPKDGSCVRPTAGTDPQFTTSRLLQPRLRLGPYESLDPILDAANPQLCPTADKFISHRIPHAPEASTAASCQYLLNNGARTDDGSQIFGCGGTSSGAGVVLPDGNTTPLGIVQGDNFLPHPPNLTTEPLGPTKGQPRSYQPGAQTCPVGSPDPACQDPWINREYEMFSVLPLTTPNNQCVLTTTREENVVTVGYNNSDPPHNTWNSDNSFRDEAGYDQNCTGFCRFPGDHTEVGGVRRIHYENAIGNLVMRVPRDPAHPTDPTPATCGTPCNMTPASTPLVPPRWAVPPEGYLVTFQVYGGLTPYVKAAQTSQRDASSGLIAQSLKAAIPALDGILFLVDEGRDGNPLSLRGQVMRVVGSLVDPYFLLR